MAKRPTKTSKGRTTRKSRSRRRSPRPNRPSSSGPLRRQNGASIAEIIAATDWLPHSVRGFFAGALKKRLKIEVTRQG